MENQTEILERVDGEQSGVTQVWIQAMERWMDEECVGGWENKQRD
jgi:hypothetical protein